MAKSELYQIFQSIQNDVEFDDISGVVLKLFEVFNETVFWVEVIDSKAGEIGVGLYVTEGEVGPFLDAYITEPDSESPPESQNKIETNGKTTFRKFNGAEILFLRSSIEFDLVVIESENELFPITGAMFEAYVGYLLSPKGADEDAKVKAILANSELLKTSWSTTQILYISTLIGVMLVLILFFLFS